MKEYYKATMIGSIVCLAFTGGVMLPALLLCMAVGEWEFVAALGGCVLFFGALGLNTFRYYGNLILEFTAENGIALVETVWKTYRIPCERFLEVRTTDRSNHIRFRYVDDNGRRRVLRFRKMHRSHLLEERTLNFHMLRENLTQAEFNP